MIIPVTYAQVNVIWIGDAVPTGAQVAFGVNAAVLSDPDAIADAVKGVFTDVTIADTFASECTIDGLLVKLGPNASGRSSLTNTLINGAFSSGAGNPASSTLVRKNTAHGGRHGRGRMYWPALPEAYILPGGQVSSDAVTALQSIFDDFLAGLEAADVGMVLLHADSTTPYPVTSLTVESRVANQRRRNRR